MSVAALRCPDICLSIQTDRGRHVCYCPDENWTGFPCSWIGYGGTYSFPACLDTIPTGFDKATRSIFIKHLRSPTVLEWSFPNCRGVQILHIRMSNVSMIQSGAFRGLPLVSRLYLDDNRISSLDPDTFLGIEKVKELNLQRNAISVISQHAFRGLPLLAWLMLDNNHLRSVPVDALLPLTALKLVSLETNRITTIDSHVLRLSHNQTLRLMLANNQLKCDANLTWFICTLPKLDYISARKYLTCASPTNLSGILLATVRKDISQTNTDRSLQEIRLGRCDETSTTTGPHTHHTSLYIPTEMPYTNTRPGSESTTGTDVVTLHGGPIITEENNSYHVNAIIMAVAVPLLMVLSAGVVVYLYERCHSKGVAQHNAPAETNGNLAQSGASNRESVTDTPAQDQTSEDNDDIEPYAVSYIDVSGKGKNGKLAPYATTSFGNIQPLEDDDDIEPYAVSYVDVSGKGKNGKLASYATTSFGNIQPIEDNDDIEPYAVSYMDVSGKGKNGKLAPYATTSFANIQTTEDYNNIEPYDDDIQPYAVSYVDVSGKGTNGKLFPCATTLINEDPGPQLQPYAVTHDEDAGPQLQPYALTHDEDPGPQLQPYGVTYDDVPGPQLQPYAVINNEDRTQAPRSDIEADVNIEPNYERGCPSTRDSSSGPYGMDEGKEVPSVSGTLYMSGSQHTGNGREEGGLECQWNTVQEWLTAHWCRGAQLNYSHAETDEGKEALGVSGTLYRSGSQHTGAEKHI
ncbi:hypothetical protein Bbelb_331620 [Branchiostoma belcheri]|nr:hypothetical protein Bbelb_331620 [Branchiostoma belcheri]